MVEHFQPPQPTATYILQDMTPDGVVLCLSGSSTKAADSITQHRKAANSWCDAGRGARSPYACRQARTICLQAVPPSVVASRINNVFHNFIVEEWCFSLVRLVFLQWTWINGKYGVVGIIPKYPFIIYHFLRHRPQTLPSRTPRVHFKLYLPKHSE